MLQISEIVKKTEEMFDLFNEHFYDNELTRPAITVSTVLGLPFIRIRTLTE